jgi:hypothetical protein
VQPLVFNPQNAQAATRARLRRRTQPRTPDPR